MHNSNKCIIPECYIDSCLVEVLLMVDKDYVNHHKGNGKVAKEMQDNFNDDFNCDEQVAAQLKAKLRGAQGMLACGSVRGKIVK